jgi:hypothetical protein
MNCSQPSPSSQKLSAFRIGRDEQGNWVALDQDGLRGGLFVSRADAVRFATRANIRDPQQIIMVAGTLELDMRRDDLAANDRTVVALRSIGRIANRPSHVMSEAEPRRVANGR